MANDKTIIRREHGRDNPYAQISRETLQNPNLSWQAKGLLAYLLSLPGDWHIYIKELPNHCRNGIKATRTAFRELTNNGYITGNKIRDNKGHYLGYEYIVHEFVEQNQLSYPRAQKRHADNGTLHNIYPTGTHNRITHYHDLMDQSQDNAIKSDITAAGLSWTPPNPKQRIQ